MTVDPRLAIVDEAIGYALDNDGERTPSARLLLERIDAVGCGRVCDLAAHEHELVNLIVDREDVATSGTENDVRRYVRMWLDMRHAP